MSTVKNYYTFGGELIGEQILGGERIDYLTDPLGNVTATVNQSCQIVNRYEEKPYGEPLSKTGSGSDPACRWVGVHGYRATGLKYAEVYVRRRHYSTELGRWISRDPIILDFIKRGVFPIDAPAAAIGYYAYTECNPTSHIDLSGLWTLQGYATCFYVRNKTVNNRWCGQTEIYTYANTVCNFRPDIKACPRWAKGRAQGAFVNVRLRVNREVTTCCPNGRNARSVCDIDQLWRNRPDISYIVDCGEYLGVTGPRAGIQLQIIDAGPAGWTGNIVDLMFETAKSFAQVNYGINIKNCDEFGRRLVTVRGW